MLFRSVAESGLPGFVTQAWYGLVSSSSTPREIVSRLNTEAVKAANSKAFRDRMEPLGFEIVTSTSEGMAEMVRADAARWAPIVKSLGIKIE